MELVVEHLSNFNFDLIGLDTWAAAKDAIHSSSN
jgi:hypothetical protein